MPHRRVLFVSYLFPPVGGVGVQRVTKFVKYLPEHGWKSSVLTASNPSAPLHDDSLVRDIPGGAIIRRARTFEPAYAIKQAVSGSALRRKGNVILRAARTMARQAANQVLQPDSQILWHPHAYRTGLELLGEVRHDAIIATGPPFSSLLLGAKLSRKTGVPLVLDYRDEWEISSAYWENKQQGWLADNIQSWQQSRAVRAAKALLATTPSSAAAVGEIARRAGSTAAVTYIYNGFDPDDLPLVAAEPAARGDAPFRLAFIGTLWNLNSIAPVIEALCRLSVDRPDVARDVELLLAGRRTDDQEAIVDRLDGSAVKVTRLPFVPHAEAVRLMQSADALLMLNSDVPKADRIINAKVFEYMAARRPMFVVAPRGDVWDVVRDLPGTVLCPPDDARNIADQLARLVEQRRRGVRLDEGAWNIDRFHRRTLAGKLAELLDGLVPRG